MCRSDNLTVFMCQLSRNFRVPSGVFQASIGVALPFSSGVAEESSGISRCTIG